MPIIVADRVLDFGLSILATESNKFSLCTTQPATYSDATTAPGSGGFMLALYDFLAPAFNAPAASTTPPGRKVTFKSVNNGAVTTAGNAGFWGVVDTVNSRLLASGPLDAVRSVSPGIPYSVNAFDIIYSRAGVVSGLVAVNITVGSPSLGVPALPIGTGALPLPKLTPYYGGPSYYSKFSKAVSSGWTNPNFFPIMVWFARNPNDQPLAYTQGIGINVFDCMEHGYTTGAGDGSQISIVTTAGEQVIVQDNEVTFPAITTNPLVPSWCCPDEIEMNAGDSQAALSYITSHAAACRSNNDGRMVIQNIGNGIYDTYWAGQYASAGRTIHLMLQVTDLATGDAYLYTADGQRYNATQSPYWPTGLPQSAAQCSGAYSWLGRNMRKISSDGGPCRPFGIAVEVAMPLLGGPSPTARTIAIPEIAGACWAAIRGEASCILFFQHNDDGVLPGYALSDATRRAAVQAICTEIASFASVLNTQSYVFNFSNGAETMLKAPGDGYAYIFAGIGLGQSPGSKSFNLAGTGITGVSAEVVGESRSITITGGIFSDSFANEYTHHTYKIGI